MAIALVEKALSVSKFSQLVAAKTGAIPVRALDNSGLKFEVYEDSDESDGPGFRVWVVSTTDAESDTRLAEEWFVGSATVSAVNYDVYAQPLAPSEAEAFKPGAFLGAWVSGAQYSTGDMVSYSGGLYTAKDSLRDNSTDPSTDAGTNWTLMLDATGKTPAELLTDIKTVDGTGSGLDADLLDGEEGTHYLDRANHTGTQTLATISDSGALAALGTVGTSEIDDEAVTLAKMAHIVTDSILGRVTASTGDVEVLTAAQVRTLINVEDGATADQTAAQILTALQTVDGTGSGLDADLLDGQEGSYHLDRANHTGTQTLSTISDSGDLAALNTVGTSEIDGLAVTDVKIANNAVTNAKLSDIGQNFIKGRVTTGIGDVEDLTAANVRTIINVEDGATADQTASEILTAIKTVDGAASGLDADLLDGQEGSYHLARGNHTGTQTLSTISDSGALAALDTVDTAEIDDEAVTLAKMAHIATDSILGRVSATTGDVEVLTAAQVRTLINVEDGATGDQTAAQILTALQTVDGTGSGLDADLLDGQEGTHYLDRANHTGTQTLSTISDSGDLAALDTVSASEIDTDAVTNPKIQNGAVTNVKLADIGQNFIKGRITAGIGDVEDLNAANVRTIINVEDGATNTGEALADANQTLTGNRTIDDGNNAYQFFVDLEDTGKKAQFLMNPANPSLTMTMNNGAGQICTIGHGSDNINLQFGTAGDLQIDSDPGDDGQVLVSTGADSPPVWEYPSIVQGIPRWTFSDFNSYDVRAQGAFLGTSISAGTSAASPAADGFNTTGFGWVIASSSTNANSGYRWDTLHNSTNVTVGLTYRAIIQPMGSKANRVGRLGATNTPMQNTPGQGIFFDLANLTLTPTVIRNSTSYTGSTYAMTADTTYILEMYQNTIDDTIFRVYAAPSESDKTMLPTSTLHNVTVTNADTDWNTNTALRMGLWVGSTGTTAEELLAIDYMGIGFQRGNA